MEGADLQFFRGGTLSQLPADTLPHLSCRLVGKCHRGDTGRLYPPVLQKMKDMGRQSAGLSGTRAGGDRGNPVDGFDCSVLVFIPCIFLSVRCSQNFLGKSGRLFILRQFRSACPQLLRGLPEIRDFPAFYSFIRVIRLPFRFLSAVSASLTSSPRTLHGLHFIRSHLRHIKQTHLPLQMIQFSLGKQPYNPVFPIESGQSCNLALSQSSDSFRNQDSRNASNLFQRNLPQYRKFRPQLLEQVSVFPLNPGACRRKAHRCADDLRQRNQTFKPCSLLFPVSFRPVCKLFHPVGHPNRQLPAADRTDSMIPFCFHRCQAETAFPVAVIVVLAFLRKELDGAFQTVSSLNRLF